MSRFRRLVLAGVIATTLTVGAVGPAFAFVHVAVPIDCAEGDEAGGIPAQDLPDAVPANPGTHARGNAEAPNPNPCLP
jgi:hypothetical protein